MPRLFLCENSIAIVLIILRINKKGLCRLTTQSDIKILIKLLQLLQLQPKRPLEAVLQLRRNVPVSL